MAIPPFVGEFNASLSMLQSAFDRLASQTINVVPVCATSTSDNKNRLDETLQQAVNTYSA